MSQPKDRQAAEITRLKALRCLGPQWIYTTIHAAPDTMAAAPVSSSSNVFLGVLFQDDGGTQTSFLIATGQTLGDALAAVDARFQRADRAGGGTDGDQSTGE